MTKDKKNKIAFIKYGGLGAGGTERWLQNVAVKLDKDKFDIDYFYTGEENPIRLKYMQDNCINLIKIKAEGKISDYGEWKNTDFFEKFDEKNYDLIQTAIAGDTEWPFYTFKTPVVHSVHLDYGVDLSDNVYHTFFLSEWMRKKNAKMGGIYKLSSVVPIGIEMPHFDKNLREELNIPQNAVVAGFHQRVDDNIFSEIPLNSFNKIQDENRYFIIIGGSKKYSEQAEELHLKNFIQLEHSADKEQISKFLNTLDIFAHGRYDGETFGYVFAEALLHKLPCLGHRAKNSNAHKETMGVGGLFAENQNDYTRKLKKLFENKKLRRNLSQKGFDYAKKKFIDIDYVKTVESVYEEIYNNPQKAKLKIRMLQLLRRIKLKMILFKKEKTDTHKIYTILGIKIAIKRKNKKINTNQEFLNDIKKIKTKLSLENNIVQLPNALMYVPDYPIDGLQSNIVEERNFFEYSILEEIDQYLKKDSVIMDIGANIGNHTVYWGKISKVKKIFSFEPVEYTYKKLLKNIEINKLSNIVKPYNLGLSNKLIKASVDFFTADNIGATTLKENEAGDISLTTVDCWRDEENPEKLDFIKIDTEGFEKEVLEGAKETIIKFKPMILIEVEPSNLDDVEHFFEEINYKKIRIYESCNFLFTYKN